MADSSDIPRWARPLGQQTWERINELLHDGWDTPDIMRELKIPKAKLRSMQVYARKFGPRRRLMLFGKFKDALLSGGEKLGPDFVKALGLVAAMAVSPDVKPSTQIRACELLTQFTQTLAKVTQDDVKAEAQRKREESGRAAIDKDEMRRRLFELYDLDPGEQRDGDGD